MGPHGRAANRPNGSDGRNAPEGPVRSGAVLDLCNPIPPAHHGGRDMSEAVAMPSQGEPSRAVGREALRAVAGPGGWVPTPEIPAPVEHRAWVGYHG